MMKKWLYGCLFLLAALGAAAEGPFDWKLTGDTDGVSVEVTVAPGHYLYVGSTQVKLFDADGREIAPLQEPEGREHYDELFGQNEWIYGAGTYRWRYPAAGTPPYRADISYQGCRENTPEAPGACLMPEEITLTGDDRIGKDAGKSAAVEPLEVLVPSWGDFKIARIGGGYMNAEAFGSFLNPGQVAAGGGEREDSGWWMIWLLAFLGGIGLNLTPCILPMIPVNLAIIGSGRQAVSRWCAFRRAAAYGLGMTLAYGILGQLVVLLGTRFGALNSSWIFNAVIAVIFAVLAVAMSGWINIDFSRFTAKIDLRNKHLAPMLLALVLGAVAALLAGACVAPVVLAVLTFAAKEYAGGAWWALALPFVLGLGMALPWPLVGIGLHVLPKPGAWMNRVKYVFAAFILVMAGYYAWLAWSLSRVDFSPLRELARLENQLQVAEATGKPVLIDFYASWCKNCAAMERDVLTDPAIEKRLEDFVVVRFNAENPGAPELAQLLNECGVTGLPAFAILQLREEQ